MKKSTTNTLNYSPVTTALLLCALCFFAACEETDGETGELQAVIDSSLASLADARLQTISDCVTDEFIAHPGKLDKKNAMRQLFVLFRINRGIFVSAPTPIVEFGQDGLTATVEAPFIVTKRPLSSNELASSKDDTEAWTALASRYAAVQQAQLSFVKEGDIWKIDVARFY